MSIHSRVFVTCISVFFKPLLDFKHGLRLLSSDETLTQLQSGVENGCLEDNYTVKLTVVE